VITRRNACALLPGRDYLRRAYFIYRVTFRRFIRFLHRSDCNDEGRNGRSWILSRPVSIRFEARESRGGGARETKRDSKRTRIERRDVGRVVAISSHPCESILQAQPDDLSLVSFLVCHVYTSARSPHPCLSRSVSLPPSPSPSLSLFSFSLSFLPPCLC